jgi:hypothetical protein
MKYQGNDMQKYCAHSSHTERLDMSFFHGTSPCPPAADVAQQFALGRAHRRMIRRAVAKPAAEETPTPRLAIRTRRKPSAS